MTPESPDWLPRRGVRAAFVAGCVVAAGGLVVGLRALAAFLVDWNALALAVGAVDVLAAAALFERTFGLQFDRRFGVAAAVVVCASVVVLGAVPLPDSVFEALAR